MDITDVRRAARRRYKTRWERQKRRRLRDAMSEIVELQVPRSLARRLHAWTPKGVGFHNLLLRVLSAGTGGKPLWESAEAFNRRRDAYRTLRESPVMSRNARCSCGSGRKFKRCHADGFFSRDGPGDRLKGGPHLEFHTEFLGELHRT